MDIPASASCAVCGNPLTPRKDREVKFCSSACYGASKAGKASWNKGVAMSAETKAKLSAVLTGKPKNRTSFTSEASHRENNPRWKGGVSHTRNGYVKLLRHGHPRADVRGYVMESIIVAEERLGRRLDQYETIHHINENRTDNRPANLYLFPSQAAHKRYHMEVRHGKRPRIETSNLP